MLVEMVSPISVASWTYGGYHSFYCIMKRISWPSSTASPKDSKLRSVTKGLNSVVVRNVSNSTPEVFPISLMHRLGRTDCHCSCSPSKSESAAPRRGSLAIIAWPDQCVTDGYYLVPGHISLGFQLGESRTRGLSF